MNGERAKEIRRSVYGEESLRNPVKYERRKNGMIIATGKRKEYLQAKKDYQIT